MKTSLPPKSNLRLRTGSYRVSGGDAGITKGVLILLVLALLSCPVLALDPTWSAAGGPPVAIAADGTYVLSDGDIFTLFGTKGEQVWRGFGGSSALSRGGMVSSPLAITRDGMYSILGTDGGLLYVDRSQRIFWQDSQFRPIQDIALSPDENFVAAVADGRVSVYTRGGDLLWRNHTYPDVQSVGISSSGLLTVAGSPTTVHAFNESGFELWNYSAPGIGKPVVSPLNSDIFVASDYTILSLHPSGNLLWKFSTGSEIRDLALSADGSSLAAGNQDGRVFLLAKDGRQLFSASLGNWANALSLSGNGSLVAAGGIDRKVYLFDRSGRQIWNYTTGGIVGGVALSADGSSLAAGADMVYYFDLRVAGPAGTTSPRATPPQATLTTPPVQTPVNPGGGTPVSSPAPKGPVPTPTPRSGSGEIALFAVGAAFLLLRRAG
jgi:WD40 repeat protein